MRAIYIDQTFLNPITVSSESPNFTKAALTDPRLVKKFRTTAITGQWVKISGAAITVEYIAILSHNLTASATIKIQGNATDSWGSPTVDETITASTGTIVHRLAASSSLNFWRVAVEDGTNTDSFLQFGRIMMGPYSQLPGMEPNQQIPDITKSKASFSLTNQSYGDERISYREFRVVCPNITTAERDAVKALWLAVKNVKPFLLLIWANELDVEPAMYCQFKKNSVPWSHQDKSNFKWKMKTDFIEVF